MKLYTKRGDKGKTDLFGGQRVEKDSQRIVACGAVDELNSTVGLAAANCPKEFSGILSDIQSRLFELGADLATPRSKDSDDTPSSIPRISQEQVEGLEKYIDETDSKVEPMTHFVLPGGSEAAARLHLSRTVCRRAERDCITLSKSEEVGEQPLIYLNRLSDLLFALARRANKLASVGDVPWIGPRGE